MIRHNIFPREDYKQRCEEKGFSYYDVQGTNGSVYWPDNACYELTKNEVDILERTTAELTRRVFDTIEDVVRKRRFEDFCIPRKFWDSVIESWDEDDPTLYMRFDFAWNGENDGVPRMLELNGDTPTSLLEASIIQYDWLTDMKSYVTEMNFDRAAINKDSDQFNSLHESLIDQWKHIRTKRLGWPEHSELFFSSAYRDERDDETLLEDYQTTMYIADTAAQAGFSIRYVPIDDISWNPNYEMFYNGIALDDQISKTFEGKKIPDSQKIAQPEQIRALFKLYPIEDMMETQFSDCLLETRGRLTMIEPLWKTLASNKQLCVEMHKLFPEHPSILPAYNKPVLGGNKDYVKKFKFGREGQGVEVISRNGNTIQNMNGTAHSDMYIYQQKTDLGRNWLGHFVIGSWVVGQDPAGIGIREDENLITGNNSSFVPHYFNH